MEFRDLAFVAGRLLLGGFFLLSSATHFMDTPTLASAAAAQGVPLPTVAVLATGLLLLGGGLAIVLGTLPRAGIALLLVFLAGVTPVMHPFWAFTDPSTRALQMGFFLRNVALAGALLALARLPTPWPASLAQAAVRADARAPDDHSRPRV